MASGYGCFPSRDKRALAILDDNVNDELLTFAAEFRGLVTFYSIYVL